MHIKTKTYIKVGLGLAVTGLVFYYTYKFIDKKITEAKLRKDKKKADLEKLQQTEQGVVKPDDLKASIGKTAFPKGDYVNVRSDASINNGKINNFIGRIFKNKPVGKILDANITGEGYVWYKIALISSNLNDAPGLGSANKNSTTGYVREDVIIIK